MARRNACLSLILAFGLALCTVANAQAAASGAAAAAAGGAAAAAGGSSAAAAGGTTTAAGAAPTLLTVPVTGIPVAPVASGYGGQVEQAVSQFQATFCVPAVYVPAVAAPANYTGEGMSITFSSGSCTQPLPSCGDLAASPPPASPPPASPPPPNGRSLLQDNRGQNNNATPRPRRRSPPPPAAAPTAASAAGGGDGAAECAEPIPSSVLECIQPSLVIQKTAALYASKTEGAAAFTGAFCKVTGVLGAPDFKVLYTFDDKTPVNSGNLASSLYGQIGSLLTPTTPGTALEGIKALLNPVVLPAAAPAAGAAAAAATTAAP